MSEEEPHFIQGYQHRLNVNIIVWEFSALFLKRSAFSILLDTVEHIKVFHLDEDLYLVGSSVLGETPAADRQTWRMMCRQLCYLMSYTLHTLMLSNTVRTGFGQRLCRMDNPEMIIEMCVCLKEKLPCNMLERKATAMLN